LQEDLWAAAACEQAARAVKNPFKEALAARLGREAHGWIQANEEQEILGISTLDRHRTGKATGDAMEKLGLKRSQLRLDCEKGNRDDYYYERGLDGIIK
jgi:hypothetical protein